MYDVAIIGAGPVGLFAAFQFGMLNLSSCVIDSQEFIGGQCSGLYPEKPIYDIPGFPKIRAQDLINNLKKQIQPFKPTYYLGKKCVKIIKRSGWEIHMEDGNIIKSKVIVIAAGAGSFEFRRPPVANLSEFENKSVFFHISDVSLFQDKVVSIAGGGDSALDWTIMLAKDIAKKVFLIHRRETFKALPNSVEKMKKLSEQGKIEIIAPYQLHSLQGEKGLVQSVALKDLEGNLREIPTEYLLLFFGMTNTLGAMLDWGINFSNNHISVDPYSMSTNLSGVFAIGDICSYPGKLKLILSGFSEAAIAAHSAYKMLNPNKPLHFQHSTTKGVPTNA